MCLVCITDTRRLSCEPGYCHLSPAITAAAPIGQHPLGSDQWQSASDGSRRRVFIWAASGQAPGSPGLTSRTNWAIILLHFISKLESLFSIKLQLKSVQSTQLCQVHTKSSPQILWYDKGSIPKSLPAPDPPSPVKNFWSNPRTPTRVRNFSLFLKTSTFLNVTQFGLKYRMLRTWLFHSI